MPDTGPQNWLLAPFREGFAVARFDRHALVILSAATLAAFGLGIFATALVPELRPGGLGALDASSSGSGIGWLIADSYRSGNVVYAAAITFAYNLIFASILQTTLPSLIAPMLGVVITIVRSVSWGILFTPIGANDPSFLVHWVTLLIEGAAYVLVGFAAYVQGRMFLTPNRYSLATRKQGYLAGIRASLRVYSWVALLLLIGAIYEAVTVIFIIA